MGEFALGQPVPRFEDPRLIRGGGRYADDVSLPGMVHGVVVRSQYAHAKILHIDTSEALKAPMTECDAADAITATARERDVAATLSLEEAGRRYLDGRAG
jgi:carbon-monoxide dehydrogenase large subunit